MNLKKALWISGKTFLGFTLLLMIFFFALTVFKMIRDRQVEEETAVSTEGISSLESVRIGGVDQWILIRGQKRDNPILLYIHGGPGATDMFLSRKIDKEIIKDFVVVHWDQRGAGKSFSPFIAAESYNKEQFFADAYELALYLKKKLNREKIYILGHSWGSYIGAVIAHRHPDDFCAFIGVGQLVNGIESEQISYDFVLKQAQIENNVAALKDLREIKEPVHKSFEQFVKQRTWLNYYGGGLFHTTHRTDAPSYIGRLMFESPDYTLFDNVRFFAGIFINAKRAWETGISTLDLYAEASSFKLPVYFMVGRHDYTTPFDLVVRFEKDLEAPRKKIYWFEISAHAPNFEEPEAFARALHEIKSNGCKQ